MLDSRRDSRRRNHRNTRSGAVEPRPPALTTEASALHWLNRHRPRLPSLNPNLPHDRYLLQ